LYKDKEISTTHAKIEIRNGQVFLTDLRSTNGTLLNNVIVEPQVPQRLKEDDKITLGTCELQVHISNFDDVENLQ
jgi:pSer/pThr/pTyr-binding forkhead associated (FHA) protein